MPGQFIDSPPPATPPTNPAGQFVEAAPAATPTPAATGQFIDAPSPARTAPAAAPSVASAASKAAPVTISTDEKPNPAKAAYDVANRMWTEGAARYKASMANPLGAAVNFEQTLARGAGTLIQHGLTPEAFGQAFHNALTPGEGDADTAAVVAKIQQHLPSYPFKGLAPGSPEERKAGFDPIGRAQGLLQGAEDFTKLFVAQTIADPVSYFPLVGALGRMTGATRTLETVANAARDVAGAKAARPLAAATKALKKIHLDAVGDMAKHVSNTLKMRPELDKYLEPHAKVARIGLEHREIANMQKELGESDAHLLEANKKGLRTVGSGPLPDAIKQRYLQEPWRYGTLEMRKQAEALGYQPTPADEPWKAAPESILDYNLREDYQYAGKVGANLKDSPLFRKYGGKRASDTFEHQRDGNGMKPEADQYDRVKSRLAMGRNVVWQRRADKATDEYLAAHGGWRPQPGKGTKPLENTLTYGPIRYDSPLRIFGRWGTQAVQGTVLPHALNNVGTLTYLGGPSGIPGIGGLIPLGRAIGYNAKGLTEMQAERIKNMGATAEYTMDPGSVWSKLPISKQVLHFNQGLLSRMEMAYRQGILDELDRTMGPSTNAEGKVIDQRLEMAKGGLIRDKLVDYRNIPLIIAVMDAAGAPFAAFLGGLTKAVAKASIAHPERVAAVTRGSQDAQTQLGVTIPNPVSTFERLIFDTVRTLLDRSGPVGGAVGDATLNRDRVDSLAKGVSNAIERGAGPWASQIPSFYNLPFNDKEVGGDFAPTPQQGIIQSLFGIYPFAGPPGAYDIKEIEKSKGRAQE